MATVASSSLTYGTKNYLVWTPVLCSTFDSYESSVVIWVINSNLLSKKIYMYTILKLWNFTSHYCWTPHNREKLLDVYNFVVYWSFFIRRLVCFVVSNMYKNTSKVKEFDKNCFKGNYHKISAFSGNSMYPWVHRTFVIKHRKQKSVKATGSNVKGFLGIPSVHVSNWLTPLLPMNLLIVHTWTSIKDMWLLQ